MQTIDTKNATIMVESKNPPSGNFIWPYSILKAIGWSIIAPLITFLVLEIILGFTHSGEGEWFKIDPVLGCVHLQNKIFTFRGEGYSRERFNSSGNCDYKRPLIKPPGVFRIAVLGDSQTESLQVQMKDRFTSLLENRFHKSGKSKVEVLNFGMSSYCTGQEYLQFVYKVAAFKPDLTILCYHDGDDQENVDLSSLRPSFSLPNAGTVFVRWVEFDHWRNSDATWVLRSFNWTRTNSRVAAILLQVRLALQADPAYINVCQLLTNWTDASQRIGQHFLYAVANKVAERKPKESAYETKVLLQRLKICQDAGLIMDTSKRLYPDTPVDYWNDATVNIKPSTSSERLQVTRAIIGLFANSCSLNGSRLVLVALPLYNQQNSYQSTLNWFASVQKPISLPALDLFPAFLSGKSQAKNPYLFPSSHFTPAGHKIAADLIYNFLERNHLIGLNKVAESEAPAPPVVKSK